MKHIKKQKHTEWEKNWQKWLSDDAIWICHLEVYELGNVTKKDLKKKKREGVVVYNHSTTKKWGVERVKNGWGGGGGGGGGEEKSVQWILYQVLISAWTEP